MKMMIEIDIPKGRSVAEAEMAVKMAFNPDWAAQWWHIDDVACQAESMGETLTEDECRVVLELVMRKHDCNIGINWDEIEASIEQVISEREKV
jgi:hypothetical protein